MNSWTQPLRAPFPAVEVSHLSAFTPSQTLRFSRSGSLANTPRSGDSSRHSSPLLRPLPGYGASPRDRILEGASPRGASPQLLPSSERRSRPGQAPTHSGAFADAVAKAVLSADATPAEAVGPAPLPSWASGWAERAQGPPRRPQTPLGSRVRPPSVSRPRLSSRFDLEDPLEIQSLASTFAGSNASSLSNLTLGTTDDEPDQFASASAGPSWQSRGGPCRRERDLLDHLILQGPAEFGGARSSRGTPSRPWQSRSATGIAASAQDCEWGVGRRRCEGVGPAPHARARTTPRAVAPVIATPRAVAPDVRTPRAMSRGGRADGGLASPMLARKDGREDAARSGSAALGASRPLPSPRGVATPRTMEGCVATGRMSLLRGTGRAICGTPT